MPSDSLHTAPAAERNQRVTFQRLKPGLAPDAGGHIDESNPLNWENHASAWVAIHPRGSREFFRREQVAADITHAIEALYVDVRDVTDEMRIKSGTSILSIAEPPRNVDQNNHTLVFACKEIK